MQKREKYSITDLLYKPLRFINEGEDNLIIIYSLDVHSTNTLSAKGIPQTTNTTTIYILDLLKTIATCSPVLDSWVIADQKKFVKNVSVVKFDDEQDNVLVSSSIIISDLNNILAKVQEYNKALTALKAISGAFEKNKDNGKLIIAQQETGFAHIVYKTMTGDIAKLSEKEVDKIGNVIMDVILAHIDINLDDTEQVNKIKAEMEYKIIEAMPSVMQTNAIHINMEAVINEIRKFQNGNNDSNDDIDNHLD